MRTTTGHVHSQPPTPSYSTSVPLYVYRELATELQTVQNKLDVVTTHNQKLAQENQILRQEIHKVVQSCLELQKLVASSATSASQPAPQKTEVKSTPNSQPVSRTNTEKKSAPKPPVAAAPPRQPVSRPAKKSRREVFSVPMMDMNFPVSEAVFIEEQEVRYYATPESQLKGLSGWWLVMTIVLIMVTGFGAGYLVVRPLLQNQNQTR
ncbi:hypothetical protein [Anabaena catenula]|uniref:Uncharacterized protein n=1 Tax=Anabaena catenula FACHB-362 TaxID=2692877 RepID=A0ABR8J4H6_9NOST|nr:hypothetical protein [Anabaena catenula]MBD2692480.1 hypothetical protein [Anabaena catenula FACHB-362]